MLQGKDRGKRGKVLSVLAASDEGSAARIVVEGLNTIKRHQRPRKQGQKGQILTKERPVDISNVQLVCPKCNAAARIGHSTVGGTKVRVCKKCGADI